MATASGGRLDEDPNFSSINAYRDCDNALQCAPVNDSRSNLLTDVLNVEESVQNCTLLQLFTPEGVSTSYVYDLPNSQLPIIENESLSNAEYINLIDSQLQNLPKEIYVNKLLELLDDDDENKVMWYRNVLYSRAKTLPDCPPGRLISRQTYK